MFQCSFYFHTRSSKILIFSSKSAVDVQDSIKFLESELERGISDNFTLALITYALSSVGSPKAEAALRMLTQQAEKEGNAWDLTEADKNVGLHGIDAKKVCTLSMTVLTFVSLD